MLTINNVQTQDKYVDALTLGPVATAEKISYLVANNAAFVQLAGHSPDKTIQPWSEEILITPTTGEFQRLQGMRFRSAVPGSPAQVVAQLVEPGDPVPIGGTPFTQSLTGSGSISPVGSVTRVNALPASPVDLQLISLVVAPDTEWLLIYNASTGYWDYLGGPPLSFSFSLGGVAFNTLTQIAASGWYYNNVGAQIFSAPFAGDYLLEHVGGYGIASVARSQAAMALGSPSSGVVPLGGTRRDCIIDPTAPGPSLGTFAGDEEKITLALNQTVAMVYSGSATWLVANASYSARPYRIH